MAAQQQEIDQQKAALLSAIAQQGSQGQQAFAAEQERRQQQQAAAVQAVSQNSQMTGSGGSAPKEFVQQLQSQQNQLGDIYAQDAAMSGQAFQNSIAQTSASNAAYMDQARAAVPIVNAQTAGQVAQIRAQQEAEAAQRQADAEARAFDMEQRRLQAQEDALDRAEAAEERELRREERTTGEEEEEDAIRQQKIVTRAKGSSPVEGAVIDALTQDAEDFRTAVASLDGYVSNVLEQYPELREDWNGDKKRQILRRLYEYYDPADKGDTLPDDPQKIGDFLRTQDLNPAERVPGYMTAADIAKKRKKTYTEDEINVESLLAIRALLDARKSQIGGGRNKRGSKRRGSDPSKGFDTSKSRRGPDPSGGL